MKQGQETNQIWTQEAGTDDTHNRTLTVMDKPSEKFSLPLSDFPLSVSHSELVLEQQADSSLSELFQLVKPDTEMEDSASGYFLQNSLLVRKWVDHKGKALGNPVFQIVVPSKFCDSVLKVAHNESGHSGINKTYDRVLRPFFLSFVLKGMCLLILKLVIHVSLQVN